MRQHEHAALALGFDPEAAAGETGVAEGVGRERRAARAVGALARPAQSVGTAALESVRDRRRAQQPRRAQPLPRERQHLAGGHEEPGVTGEAAQRPRIAVLRHAAQEGGLARELHSLLRSELDLFPVVEAALDSFLRRRMARQRAERREAERRGDVAVEQVGQARAGRLLGRKTPEDVAEVAVSRAVAGLVASLLPQAFGQ